MLEATLARGAEALKRELTASSRFAIDALLQGRWRSPKGTSREYLPGDVIADRYRLIALLGSGGMGVIWRARALRSDVDVAIKLIGPRGTQSSSAERMAREAHVTALLSHRSIVQVLDFGWTTHDEPFIVMELVQGESLGELLHRRGPLAADLAVKLMLPVLDALRCAHEQGIVHRDVKPENILVGRDAQGRQQPKLLDFGLAKVRSVPARAKRLTGAGMVVGSVEYMAPEQARGLEVDERADVWAACVVLYECVVGLPPWRGTSQSSVMRAIVTEPPASLYENATIDLDFWVILERGLRKNPDERWPSMSALGEELALWLYQGGCKEDISGSSLSAVWLDRSLVEPKIHRPSLVSIGRAKGDALAAPTQKKVQPSLPRARRSGVHRRSKLRRVLWPSTLAIVLIAIALGVSFGLVIGRTIANLQTTRAATATQAVSASLPPSNR